MNSALIKTDFNMTYDPTQFWLEMGGKRYRDLYVYDWIYQIQERMLIDYLKTIEFDSVLEVGCGFGRITKLLLENFDIPKYMAIDISPDQIRSAKEYIKGAPHADDVAFLKGDFASSTGELVKFDLVISVEMLMHILPRDIKYVVQKMMSVSNKHVINVDWYEEPEELMKKPIAPINFVHDYQKLYGRDKCKRIPIRNQKGKDTLQSIFHTVLH